MRRYWYIIVISYALLCGCNGGGAFWGYGLKMLADKFEERENMERVSLVGCDTVALPGDKKQIAAAFLANIDVLWAQMKDSLEKNPKLNICAQDFLYDPHEVYSNLITYTAEECGFGYSSAKLMFLPDKPSVFYHAGTDLVVYSKDKLLCWAFVVIRQDLDKGGRLRPPYYGAWNVIARRKAIDQPFKIYVRSRNCGTFGKNDRYKMIEIENKTLSIPGETYDFRDVYVIENEESLPVLSDPDFFEKHPLFQMFNDSTYNFEWFMRQEYGFYRKRYPEMYRYPY